MKEAFQRLLENIADLLKVKSLITMTLTGVMVAMLVGSFQPTQEFVTLFCTSYGAIITYFFTKKGDVTIPEVKTETVFVDKEPTNNNYE